MKIKLVIPDCSVLSRIALFLLTAKQMTVWPFTPSPIPIFTISVLLNAMHTECIQLSTALTDILTANLPHITFYTREMFSVLTLILKVTAKDSERHRDIEWENVS